MTLRTATPVAALAAALSLSFWSVCGADEEEPAHTIPAGLPPVVCPKDNPQTAAKVALGRHLFFDKRLSSDNTISCASCHDPAKGWSNGERFATGVGGQVGGRSAPSIINSTYNMFQFWDGRSGSLEDQALGPIQNPIEMGMTLPEVVKKLNAIQGYRDRFQKVFGSDVTAENIGRAIAAYERTVLSGDAPFDRFVAGDKQALSEGAQRGKNLFFGQAHCSACHSGPAFTDNAFHNLGVGHGEEFDRGRHVVSKVEGDTGSFKTPGLREIAKTAPYMHDGSLKTLEDVIDYYDKGGTPNKYLDEEMFPLKLTKEQKADLVLFLKEGLSSPKCPLDTAPPPIE